MSDSQSRIEELLNTLITDGSTDLVPQTEVEIYLKACIDKTGTSGLPEPTSRMTLQLKELADELAGGGGGGGSANLLQSSVTANRQAGETYGDMVNLGYALGLEEGKEYTVKYKFNDTEYSIKCIYTSESLFPVAENVSILQQFIDMGDDGSGNVPLPVGDGVVGLMGNGCIIIADKKRIDSGEVYTDDENNAVIYLRALSSDYDSGAASVEITSIEEVVE